MKLEPEGKNRLEAMKKRLAAGLPLAGMLAASAAVGPMSSQVVCAYVSSHVCSCM